MSACCISYVQLNENLHLSECPPDSECRNVNWWLYDERAGLNIAMREESRDAAFVEAIEYWTERAVRMEEELKTLRSKVAAFVNSVEGEDAFGHEKE